VQFAYPLGVHVTTTIGCLKAVGSARSSIAFACSQAAALLYSVVVTATPPPENRMSVSM
jgi:hypothetical protein